MGGFSDGSLKLYSSNRGEKLVEIAAHGRWINTVDIAKTQGLVCCSRCYSVTVSLSLCSYYQHQKMVLHQCGN